MAIKDSYPSVRPSFDLNFASSRIIDPRITFTRASTATYFDEFGVMRTAPANTPRIDFDRVTGECKGLLIEQQKTNLLTYSEQFDNAAWAKSRMTVATNATTAPDGTLTADKLVEDTTASATHGIAPSSFSAVSGTPYTFSVYLRASDTRRLQVIFLAAAFGTNIRATFNVVAGTVVTNGGTATITPIGAGFYRCAFTATATATVTTNININLANADNADLAAITYTGDGTSGIYLWGAQLETGNAPTSYIPTTSAQVTRAGDILSLTGLNASSWYKQDEGTFLIEFTPYTELQSTVRMLIGSNPGYIAYFLQNSARLGTYDGTNTTIANNGAVAGSKQKAVVAYSGSSVTLTIDGTNPVTGTFDGGYGADIYIGCLSNGTQLNGWIRRISYYPKPLQNSNLLALTA